MVEHGLLVLGQSVVHVESNGLEVVEAQFAIAENVRGGNGSIIWKIGKGREGEIERLKDIRVARLGSVPSMLVQGRLQLFVAIVGLAVGCGDFSQRLFGFFIRVYFVR